MVIILRLELVTGFRVRIGDRIGVEFRDRI